jgi:hypothetical protein
MSVSGNSVRPIGHKLNSNELSPSSPADEVEFFAARHPLVTDSERVVLECETDCAVPEWALRRVSSVGLSDSFEEGYCWLISAATLAFLALGILAL